MVCKANENKFEVYTINKSIHNIAIFTVYELFCIGMAKLPTVYQLIYGEHQKLNGRQFCLKLKHSLKVQFAQIQHKSA